MKTIPIVDRPNPRTKKVPESVTIFGAAGHMGGPLARQLQYQDPKVHVRLVSSSPAKADALRATFPEADCVVADLFRPETLPAALEGAEGVFVVTPSPFDEAVAMANLIEGLHRAEALTHLVRIVGYEPESQPRRVPAHVREFGGTAQQHYVAKRLLDESDLPATYLNIGATYLDNLLAVAPGVITRRTLVWPDRVIPFIDPRDIGELAANLLLSPDGRHLHQFHTLNNGHDLLTTSELAEVMGDVLKVRLDVDTDEDSFVAEYGERLAVRRGVPDAARRVLDFIDYEQCNTAFFALNDLTERLLGRPPVTLRAWLMEHRAHFEA